MMRTVRLKRLLGTAVRNGLFRCVLVVAVTLSAWRTGYVPGTNAVFTDKGVISGGSLSAGAWIPTLSIASITPSSPDGDNGFYKTIPCIKLVTSGLSSGTATVYYAFSIDGDLKKNGQKYEKGYCIPVPEGNDIRFRAVAINDANDAWRSAEVSQTFSVDTECPKVRLEKPHERGRKPGRPRRFEVHASVSDKNADRYWVTFEKKDDRSHSDRKEVNRDKSFTDEEVFDWEEGDREGAYEIKIEARDRAGNTCSDGGREWKPEHDRSDDPERRGNFTNGQIPWSEISGGIGEQDADISGLSSDSGESDHSAGVGEVDSPGIGSEADGLNGGQKAKDAVNDAGNENVGMNGNGSNGI